MAAGPSERSASGRQGKESTIATTRATTTAANSVALHSTYSQANNHYATATTTVTTTNATPLATNANGGQRKTPQPMVLNAADTNSRQADSSNSNDNCTAAIAAAVRRRRLTLTETSLSNFVRAKANRPLTCLLVAALCASVLNTLLLSFVIKTIQLNDRGFINGKLAWNEQLAATTLNSKAKLPGKSISVQSIESFGDDRALRIEKLSRSPSKRTASSNEERLLLLPTRQAVDDESVLFAIDDRDGDKGDSRQLNYMKAVNSNAAGTDRDGSMLEIGAKSFALNLITSSSEAGKQREQIVDGYGGAHPPISAATHSSAERVLEFNGERQSITLNREEQLRLSPAASGSLAVEGELWSPNITGSLAQSLDLQTRNGPLVCSAKGTMRLVSKSGAIQLAGPDGVQLDSGRGALTLHSKRLLIPTGIRYFDPPVPSRALEEQPTRPTLREQHRQLGAYELIAVNGLLMATG